VATVASRIWSWFAGKPRRSRERFAQSDNYVRHFGQRLRARYDAAQTTDENERHWANADTLGPNSSALPSVRRKIRQRARYEAGQNNSYAFGMMQTLANDLIGTCPRLQLMTPDKEANRRVERSFARWAYAIHLGEKLRTMRVARAIDGEAFALFDTNPRIMHPVTLDVMPIECDYFDADFTGKIAIPTDSIDYDSAGNPVKYYKRRVHPGETSTLAKMTVLEPDELDARFVLHSYRVNRPEQRRGVSEIATALPLFAMLRRFTLATLAAAETAADFAAVMYTDAPAQEIAALGADEWFDAIPMEYRAMLTLPNGWKMSQFKAEHPTTTYSMFKEEIIGEVSRCLGLPRNVALSSSKDYNYSSGKLDHLNYGRQVMVERSQWEARILDRIMYAWLDEAMLIPDLLPSLGVPFAEWDWRWQWDATEAIDDQKLATANEIKLKTGQTHRGLIYQQQGLDIDAEDERAAELAGVSVEDYRQSLFESTIGLIPAAEPVSTEEPADVE